MYSQTEAFTWDEGFHLLAAQLIARGERPYLDFFFPQAPLNAYWTALWMRAFSDTWQVAHALAAVLAWLAALIAGAFLLERFPARRWAFFSALSALTMMGLNFPTLQYGTVGQGYALALVLEVAGFWLTLRPSESRGFAYCAAAGFCAAAAAESTLLVSACLPVLFLWTVAAVPGRRVSRGTAFLTGSAIALAPLIRLFAAAPRIVLFDVIDYHLLYRKAAWPDATANDLHVFFAWTQNPQAILLLILSLTGLWFVHRRSEWSFADRAPFYLAATLAAALAAHISTAHPTFERYYLLTVPFLAILSAAGLYAISRRFTTAGLPMSVRRRAVPGSRARATHVSRESNHAAGAYLPLAAVFLIAGGTLVWKVFQDHDSPSWWSKMREVALGVDRVTPRNAPLLAEEAIYFLTRREPPEGLTHHDALKLSLAPGEAEKLHIISRSELIRRIAEFRYASAETCAEPEDIADLNLGAVYLHRAEFQDCVVYWP